MFLLENIAWTEDKIEALVCKGLWKDIYLVQYETVLFSLKKSGFSTAAQAVQHSRKNTLNNSQEI